MYVLTRLLLLSYIPILIEEDLGTSNFTLFAELWYILNPLAVFDIPPIEGSFSPTSWNFASLWLCANRKVELATKNKITIKITAKNMLNFCIFVSFASITVILNSSI